MWQKPHRRNSRDDNHEAPEHRHSLKQGLLEKSGLTQYTYEVQRVGLDEARDLEIESNSRYMKYKVSAHIECLINPISQPSLNISLIRIPLISNEVNNIQERSV
jgi:hypothetical protein